jgi:uroporphyrin-III C-methyltransferase
MPSEPPGFVAFVSAGPGDPDLLTLKAVDRLARADAVLYDDLAPQAVLAHARPGADLIGVGKRAGRASPRQDHVSRLLVDYARAGAFVVRLKSGDAGLFGRLEEEILALAAAGIGFEIVPGVTAASAAAAAAGIPLTRRLTARRVQFVTGADTEGRLPATLDWAALADPQAVSVIYMGRRTFPALAARLIATGLPPDTPALLAEAVGHPGQRLTRATLATLPGHPALAEGTAPALILLGPLADPVARG